MMTKEAQHASSLADIDFTKHNPKSAITYEFCAGIVDKKNLSNKEHAHAEILEECGYSVDINSIESVTKYRTGVGTVGAHQELFYVEVTNEMKTNVGGGNASEGERKIKLKNSYNFLFFIHLLIVIVIHEVPVDKLYEFLFDETKAKEASLMFGIMWFLHKKGRLP
jgi:UDP-sugar diphosphatase